MSGKTTGIKGTSGAKHCKKNAPASDATIVSREVSIQVPKVPIGYTFSPEEFEGYLQDCSYAVADALFDNIQNERLTVEIAALVFAKLYVTCDGGLTAEEDYDGMMEIIHRVANTYLDSLDDMYRELEPVAREFYGLDDDDCEGFEEDCEGCTRLCDCCESRSYDDDLIPLSPVSKLVVDFIEDRLPLEPGDSIDIHIRSEVDEDPESSDRPDEDVDCDPMLCGGDCDDCVFSREVRKYRFGPDCKVREVGHRGVPDDQ